MKTQRSLSNKWVAGVCGGLAEQAGWSPARLRFVWVLATVFTAFAGLVAYIALWFLMPKAAPPQPQFEPAPLQPWRH